ncbi:hypothetical protein [Micromonospora humi]|uniref:PH domain-containing protein n=1 Tax=Micromonospora humi TaxID=745366 RepID=A0A1C5I316_9ACTN|nr:hypothetical protein [Micromonospora humi]SCG52615.1 hypothetical protein GA0070213_104373 [Micromonospora humi]
MREIIGAALRRQRRVVLVAVAAGLVVGLFSRWAGSVDTPLSLLGLVAPLVMIAFGIREFTHRPPTGDLRVDEAGRAFFAPPRARIAFAPVLMGWLGYVAVDGAGPPLLTVLLVVVLGWLLVAHWRSAPLVVLTAEEIGVGTAPAVVVPWAALGPTGAVAEGAARTRLAVARPELVRPRWRGRFPVDLPVRDLTVAPALLAAAIGHYAARPEHRAAIGTAAEHARLRRELTGERPS